MQMLRTVSRALAIAVAAAWMLAPSASFGATNTYSCVASSFSANADGQGNLTVSCTDPAPTTSTSCTVTPATSTLPSSGGTVNLIASNCGTATWSVSPTTATVTPTTTGASVSVPSNTGGTTSIPYTVTLNGTGTPASVTASITVSAPPTTPPPTGGTISCSGYQTQVIDLPWGRIGSGNVQLATTGFGNGMIVVGRFTTPNVVPTTVARAGIGAVTSIANVTVYRTAALSLTPCDFPVPNPIGNNSATVTGTPSPNVTYQIGGPSPYYAVLQPNTTYYFNIKNEVNGAPTCPAGKTCDMYVQLRKPFGW